MSITLIGLKFGDKKTEIVFNFKNLTNVLCSMCDVYGLYSLR